MTRVQLVLSTLVLSVAALTAQAPIQQMPGVGPNPTLPDPKPDQNAKNFVKVVGWPKDATPEVPDGFTVTRFADGLQHPRWLHRLPNGDILVAEAATKPKPPKKGPDVLHRRPVPRALPRRRVHRPARLVEPHAAQRLPAPVRAVQEGTAGGRP